MRVANLDGRLVIVTGEAGHEIGYDVEKSSGGQFSADPQAVYDVWGAFTTWAAAGQFTDATPVRPEALGSPAPAPRQVFGIGLNYREHAAESGFDAPAGEPPVFTKFPSCITGPTRRHRDAARRERRLGGRAGRRHRPPRAPGRAGRGPRLRGRLRGRPGRLRAGLQLASTPPQFSMGKSLPGYGPIGPWLVTLDDIADPNDLELGCEVNGEVVQLSRTSQLIFSVPALIENLSASVPAAARRRHLHRHPLGRRTRPQAPRAFSPTATC